MYNNTTNSVLLDFAPIYNNYPILDFFGIAPNKNLVSF